MRVGASFGLIPFVTVVVGEKRSIAPVILQQAAQELTEYFRTVCRSVLPLMASIMPPGPEEALENNSVDLPQTDVYVTGIAGFGRRILAMKETDLPVARHFLHPA